MKTETLPREYQPIQYGPAVVLKDVPVDHYDRAEKALTGAKGCWRNIITATFAGYEVYRNASIGVGPPMVARKEESPLV